MTKDQENLISHKVDTILNKFLKSISQYDNDFDGGCVSRFVETDAKGLYSNKISCKKTPVADKGKKKKRKSSTFEARNELR